MDLEHYSGGAACTQTDNASLCDRALLEETASLKFNIKNLGNHWINLVVHKLTDIKTGHSSEMK